MKWVIILVALLNIAGASRTFDGTGDCLNSASSITYGSNVITLTFWIKWDSYNDNDDVGLESSTNFNNNDATFLVLPDESTFLCSNEWAMSIQDGTTGATAIRSECYTRPSATVWHHIAAVFDNSTATGDIKFYVDGSEVAANSIGRNDKDQSQNFSAQTLYVMSRACSSLESDGDMAHLHIYDRELSAQEVAENYIRPNTPANGLLHYWPIWGANSPEGDLAGSINMTVTNAAEESDGPPIQMGGGSA